MEPRSFARVSPANGETLEEVGATEPASVAAIVERARAAQVAWASRPLGERIRVVAGVSSRILARAEEIAASIRRETGKPEVEALLGEVLPSADVVAYWQKALPDELEPFEPELDALSYPKKSALLHREARGTIAVIMPWNFPFALPLRTIVPALMVGNAVVFKPSEVTPRVGELLASLFEGLLPPDLLVVVQGAGDVGAALCASKIDGVVFTGSPESGRKVAVACAERLVPCALELGGKDAAIVLRDADLERAANGIVWGAMMNAGQNCGAVERVYVEAPVAAALTEKIVAATRALRPGLDVGSLTTPEQRAVVEEHVRAARDAGAEVLVGGGASPPGAYGFAPTVLRLDGAEGDHAILRDETFGPVVPIVTVADADEAVSRANASRYGLTASVWTSDLDLAQVLARRLRAGVVTVNNHSFTGAVADVPWSGVGESGWGVTGSPLALDHLTRPRLVLVDRNRARRELWWYPYSDTLRGIALSLARMKGGTLGQRVGAVMGLLSLLPRRSRELKSGVVHGAPAAATPGEPAP